MRLNIAKKLSLGMGFLLSLFLISVVLSYLQTHLITREIREITEIETPISETAREMEIHILNIATAVLRYHLDGNPVYKKLAQEYMASFDTGLAVYKTLGTTQQHQQTELEINRLFARYTDMTFSLFNLHDSAQSTVTNLLEVSKEMIGMTENNMESLLTTGDPQYDVKAQQIKKIQNDLNLINRNLASYTSTHQPAWLDQAEAGMVALSRSLTQYQDLPLSFEEQDAALELGKFHSLSQTLFSEFVAIDNQNELDINELLRLRDQLMAFLEQEIMNQVTLETTASKQSILQSIEKNTLVMTVLLVLGLVCGVLTGILLTRNITLPIKRLVRATDDLKYWRTYKPIAIESSDEFQALANSFNEMAVELQRANTELQVAHHDLDIKVEQRTSDLKESYKALAKLEQRFAQLLNLSPSAIYATSVDKPHCCRYVSQAFTELTGYEADEVIANPDFWLNHIHPEDRQWSTNSIDQTSATGGGAVTYRFRHKNGEYRWIRDNFRVVNDAEERPFEIIGAWTDVTKEKTAAHALKESEERFRIAAESSNDLIYEWNMNTGAILWFGDIDGVLNYTPEVFPRTREAWEKSLHPEDQARVRDANEKHLADPAVPFDQQYRIRTRNGQYKTWRDCGMLVMRDGKETGKWIGSCTDITKAKRLEQQFMQAQKMETVGLLAGGIAHDFNNLLTAIIGFSDMCLQSQEIGATNREYINEVKNAGMRAADLTRQLLAFSRKQVITPVALDLNGIVTGMEKMFRRLIAEDIHLTLTLEPSLRHVIADVSQLEQIVMNLVINARDAMPNGGDLMIQTSNVELDKNYVVLHPEVIAGPYVMLAISDTGTGIRQEDQERIFEPFFTTKEKGKGTGLGLATVYGIVKQSNGYIYLYSEPGMGTTFRIYLPPAEGLAALAGTASESRQLMSKNNETVLLVEDESNVRSLAHMILKSCGYKIMEAKSGDEALRLCDQHAGTIHLLLSDVIMPGMNGHELATRLIPRYPGLRVLYISGYTDDVITRHGILTEGTVFLSKPFTSEALARKVHDVLYKK